MDRYGDAESEGLAYCFEPSLPPGGFPWLMNCPFRKRPSEPNTASDQLVIHRRYWGGKYNMGKMAEWRDLHQCFSPFFLGRGSPIECLETAYNGLVVVVKWPIYRDPIPFFARSLAFWSKSATERVARCECGEPLNKVASDLFNESQFDPLRKKPQKLKTAAHFMITTYMVNKKKYPFSLKLLIWNPLSKVRLVFLGVLLALSTTKHNAQKKVTNLKSLKYEYMIASESVNFHSLIRDVFILINIL